MREMEVNGGTAFGAKRSPRSRRFLLIIILVLFSLLACLYITRALAIHRLQHEVIGLLDQENVALTQQKSLQARLAQKDDLQAIEDVARAQLGLVKPGEEKIIFVRKGD